jgi:hypothetical protein
MRGSDERSGSLFSYVDLESRVRGDHPRRTIRAIANAALSDLSKAFTGLHADFGRPSIAPAKLLRATLFQAFSLAGQLCRPNLPELIVSKAPMQLDGLSTVAGKAKE